MNQNQNDENYEIKITDENEENPEKVETQHIEPESGNEVPAESQDEQESAENNCFDQLQRLKAEFANYKKRVDKERLELSNIFKSELVISLLPAIDDFERFFDHAHSEEEDLVKGVKLIYQKFLDILKMQGLNPIKAVGEKFDPAIHEAVYVEQTENGEDGLISEEWRKGYLFNKKLIRPTQVKVVKSVKGDEN